MRSLMLAAAGGAIGAAGRYLVGVWAVKLLGHGFPWGTLIVNIVGSFLMGVLIEFLALRYSASMEVRIFLATGILGGFTTFSAFSLDVATLLERHQALNAFIYMFSSVGLSIAALFAGLYVIRLVS